MPNWTTNRLTITGDNAAEILNSLINEETEFDFNKIVPMPEMLSRTEASSSVTNLIDKLTKHIGEMPSLEWCKENTETIEEFARGAHPRFGDGFIKKTIENTINSIECLEKYGYADWYSWSLDKWGCKWNASETYMEDGSVVFLTPWASPEPVIRALSVKYPDNKFILEFADENYGYNCGRYTFSRGKMDSSFRPDSVENGKKWVAKHFPDIFH